MRSSKQMFKLTAVSAGLLLASVFGGTAHAGAIIDNGTVQLGVRDLGNLNQEGGTSATGSSTTIVGLRSMATGSDSTSPGCTCEGWGVAIKSSGVTGYVNDSSAKFGVGLTSVSFTSTASTAKSVVDVAGGVLRVTHEYAPLASTPYLYQVSVSITNTSGKDLIAGDLLYRRVMDWDIPRPGREAVTIQGVPALRGIANGNNVRRTGNNGFDSANPLSPDSGLNIGGGDCASGDASVPNSNFKDCGPSDHGALFDFEFEALAAGATRTFATYYGVAPSIEAADLARRLVDGDASDVEIGLYSYGTCTSGLEPTVCDRTSGAPNTFIFGFGAAGGVLDPDPDDDDDDDGGTGTVPEPGSVALLGLGLLAMGAARRRNQR